MSVSILIPLFNGIEFLEECLRSILNQTYTDFEVLVGLNGHDINSETYVKCLKLCSVDQRIGFKHYQYYEIDKKDNEPTNNKSITLNQMVNDIRSDIICLLDVDDNWEPRKLEEQMKVWSTGEWDVVSTRGKMFGNSNMEICPQISGDISNCNISSFNPIVNSSVMIKKRDAYWLENTHHEDYEMWFRFRHLRKRMFIIDQILTNHRVHDNSFFNSKNIDHMPLVRKWDWISPVTIVTAYFPMKSKFNHDTYMNWIRNFLENIPCHLYIYTDPVTYEQLKQFRSKYEDQTRYGVMNFGDMRMNSIMDTWKQQKEIDQEKYHTEELYIIWNEKTEFVRRSIEDNVFKSDYFFWCDIGAFRDKNILHNFVNFPNPSKVYNLNKNKIHILEIEEIKNYERELDDEGFPKHSFERKCRSGGGIFGGHKDAWEWWEKKYYDTMNLMLSKGRFIGKDQDIMTTIAVMHPDRIKYIKHKPYFRNTGDMWFYMEYYLK